MARDREVMREQLARQVDLKRKVAQDAKVVDVEEFKRNLIEVEQKAVKAEELKMKKMEVILKGGADI